MALSVLCFVSGPVKRFFFTMALAGMASVAAVPAQAAGADELNLKYDIYSFGLRVATLKFDINVDGKNYTAQTKMKTKGLLNFIKSSNFKAVAAGTLTKKGLAPKSFDLNTKSKKKGKRNAVIAWNQKRVPSVQLSYQRDDYKVDAVKKKIQANMPDPITALLSASLQSSKTLCRDSYRVLDGATIYDIKYSFVGQDDFGDGDAGVYRGKAFKCEISYKPVAGLSKKKWAKIKARKDNGVEKFTVWMAPVKSATRSEPLFVPVGAVASLGGKTAYAYLMRASLSGKPLNASSKLAAN